MSIASQARSSMSPEVKRGVIRWAIRETLGTVMLAALLFLSAGTAQWIMGWVMVVITAGWVLATALVVIPYHPELLAERVGPKRGAKTWDTAILGIYGLLSMAVWVVAGLDVRYGWSTGIVPAAHLIAMVIMIAGYALVVWATMVNAFFSQVVRIQTERGHHVVSDGPYHSVRHPSYVGMILFLLSAPIMLGSWWACVPGALAILSMIVRTALEDKTLKAELPGYAAYAQRTRYRLLPGIW